MEKQLTVLNLGISHLTPVNDLKIFSGFEKWKDLNTQWTEDDVGVTGAAQAETKHPVA